MRENSVLQAWRGGGQTIGGWLSIGNAYTAEVMSGMGFDYLCVDLQHGMLSYDDLTYMLPAISTQDTIPLVRVPWNEPYEIMKALDAGAYGVIVPMVNNAQEAAQAVAACRYPPDGNRSFGPIRAAIYGGRGYAAEANGHIACIAMVETAEAIEELDEIAATPGLDAIYIGPSDLGYALGLGPAAFDDPLHVETVQRIFAACRANGVAAGIHAGSLAFTRKCLEQGFNLITLGSDAGFMGQAARRDLAAAREGAVAEGERTGY